MENQSSLRLDVGAFYKIFDISEFMAHTIASVIKIQAFNEEQGRYIFSAQGKRKKYYLRVTDSTIILPLCHNVLKADSETGSFTGNALLNLMGTPAEIKKVIEESNLNPTLDKSRIVAVQRENDKNKETPVFMEEARRSSHGVMERLVTKIK